VERFIPYLKPQPTLWIKDLSEKLIVAQLTKKFRVSYGIRKFIKLLKPRKKERERESGRIVEEYK
jgi:hypothetical protein